MLFLSGILPFFREAYPSFSEGHTDFYIVTSTTSVVLESYIPPSWFFFFQSRIITLIKLHISPSSCIAARSPVFLVALQIPFHITNPHFSSDPYIISFTRYVIRPHHRTSDPVFSLSSQYFCLLSKPHFLYCCPRLPPLPPPIVLFLDLNAQRP